jgi:hypothetical protein
MGAMMDDGRLERHVKPSGIPAAIDIANAIRDTADVRALAPRTPPTTPLPSMEESLVVCDGSSGPQIQALRTSHPFTAWVRTT